MSASSAEAFDRNRPVVDVAHRTVLLRMRSPLSHPYGPRRTLFVIGAWFSGLAAVLAVVWFFDLRDGRMFTPEDRGGPWVHLSRDEDEAGFLIALTMQYGVPVVLLGTVGLVSFLGGLAQPKPEDPRDG